MEPHSNQSRSLSKEDLSFDGKLGAAMQHPIEIAVVRMWLKRAQAEGLEPERIYDAAVKVRPQHWDPAPPFEVVNPAWG